MSDSLPGADLGEAARDFSDVPQTDITADTSDHLLRANNELRRIQVRNGPSNLAGRA